MALQTHDNASAMDDIPDRPQPGSRPVALAVVEDDLDYRESFLVPRLTGAGFAAQGMASALHLYRAMTMRRYDLVLLDAGLPDEDGFGIAAHLRSLSDSVGIVMLTGLDPAHSRLRGLHAGVDAYLNKPVDMETLTATLWNLTRRVGAPATRQPPAARRWRLGESGWRLLAPGGGSIAMTLAEYQVLSMLAAQPGTPVRREALIARLVENVHDFDPHRLEMVVYRLRRKCLQFAGEELPLRAVRGVGYVLVW